MTKRSGLLLLALVLTGCRPAEGTASRVKGNAPPPPPAAAGAVGAHQPSASTDAAAEFSAAYRRASEQEDLEGLLRLYCWDGVPADLRETIRGNAQDELLATIDTIEIVPLAGAVESRVEGGITWKANLRPTAEARVNFKPHRPGDFLVSKLTWHLGMKNGRYLISVMVPE